MASIENEKCQRCKAKDSLIIDFQYDEGEIVCINCGLVYQERIIADENQRRAFENNEGPAILPYGNKFGKDLIIHKMEKLNI